MRFDNILCSRVIDDRSMRIPIPDLAAKCHVVGEGRENTLRRTDGNFTRVRGQHIQVRGAIHSIDQIGKDYGASIPVPIPIPDEINMGWTDQKSAMVLDTLS